jgi:hypothetical protein
MPSHLMKKTIPEYIIDGSIVVDSLEAFASILREFPGRPELLRMHADLLVAGHFQAAAVQQYDEAARLFLEAGRLLPAWVSKILQWQLLRPSRDQLVEFHHAIESTPHNGAPADAFLQDLDPIERMAVFARSRRICAPAGENILIAGKRYADLHLVVSGIVKESCYEMLSEKPKSRREACRVLWEADSFGEVYPFSEEVPVQPHIVTNTRTELLVISRRRLMRACRRHPNVESGIIRLCRIRAHRQAEPDSDGVRKGLRYTLATCMSVEILPLQENEPPILLRGQCSDLSVSGVSFIPEADQTRPAAGEAFDWGDLINRKVRVTISAGELSIAISGQIVRQRSLAVKGLKAQSLGIQFAEVPPRLRGAFFAFAESATKADPPPPRS